MAMPQSGERFPLSATAVNVLKRAQTHGVVASVVEPVNALRPKPALARADLLSMGAGLGLMLLISYLLGRGHVFWEDEMLGWMLLHDPSWRHMITAWQLGADGGGFSFYLTGRAWFTVFGASDVSFRMYSATCFGLAFCVLWTAARRYYGFWIVAFAMFNSFFFSPTIVLHMAEGRFYGLLMLSTGMAVWLVLAPTRDAGKTRVYLYPLTFLVHGLLTTSHLLGMVYSFFLLAAMIVVDWSSGRRRPLLYACGVASWLLLIPERTAILASAEVGNPHFWTKQPGLRQFFGAYGGFSIEIEVVLACLCVVFLLSLRRSGMRWREALTRAFDARRPVWTVTLALLLIPIAFLIEGLFGVSLFINRYLMPIVIAQVFLTAECLRLIRWQRVAPRLQKRFEASGFRVALVSGFAVALLVWNIFRVLPWVQQQPNYTKALTAMLPKGVPVVLEDAWSFTEIIGRQHASGVDYLYLLDWPESVRADAPRLEVTQYHLMENWRKAGYFGGSILYRDEFLAQHRDFLVIHTETYPKTGGPLPIGNPLAQRFAHTAGYEVRPYAVLPRKGILSEVWLVCPLRCAADGRPRSNDNEIN